MKRRTFDILAAAGGLFLAVTLIVSGVLLTWAHNFVGNEVHDPARRTEDLLPACGQRGHQGPENQPRCSQYAGQQLTTGAQAETYADHFIAVPPDQDRRRQDLRPGQRRSSGQPRATPSWPATVATVFQGQTLRGLLLNAYAFATMGTIAGIAAIAAFIAAAFMLILSGLGLMHARRVSPAADILTRHSRPTGRPGRVGHRASRSLVAGDPLAREHT